MPVSLHQIRIYSSDSNTGNDQLSGWKTSGSRLIWRDNLFISVRGDPMLSNHAHATVSGFGHTGSDQISKYRWAEPSAVLGVLILDSLQVQTGPTPVLFINLFFIFRKAKHFLWCWIIANTLGSSCYLHGSCPCHVFGLVEDNKARAVQFFEDTESSMNFPRWWYLNGRKLTCMLYPSWCKFLNKVKMESVPPQVGVGWHPK